MPPCPTCAVPSDAIVFDASAITDAPALGLEVVLARYELHRNYRGVLLYFAQFTDRQAAQPGEIETPGYQWEIRCNGRARDPYFTFSHIINPWGVGGPAIALRLEPDSLLEFVVRRAGSDQGKPLTRVGGRLVGRAWYDVSYGGERGPQ